MKLIIDAILGGMYLVTTESQGKTTPLHDQQHSPKCFQCLDQIKHYFEDYHIDEVILREDNLLNEFMGISEGSTATTLHW